MSRPAKPFTTPRRGDSKTFQITINCSSGLPWKVCREWRRRSFQDLPDTLIQFRNPKTKAAAEAGAVALISSNQLFMGLKQLDLTVQDVLMPEG